MSPEVAQLVARPYEKDFMLHRRARAFLLLSIATLATSVGTIESRVALALALLVSLFLMWMAGVADGHEHLRRKNPEAFGELRNQSGKFIRESRSDQ